MSKISWQDIEIENKIFYEKISFKCSFILGQQ